MYFPVFSLTFRAAIMGFQAVSTLHQSFLFITAACALHFKRCCITVWLMSPLVLNLTFLRAVERYPASRTLLDADCLAPPAMTSSVHDRDVIRLTDCHHFTVELIQER